eukprot:tig00021312_g20098.t1
MRAPLNANPAGPWSAPGGALAIASPGPDREPPADGDRDVDGRERGAGKADSSPVTPPQSPPSTSRPAAGGPAPAPLLLDLGLCGPDPNPSFAGPGACADVDAASARAIDAILEAVGNLAVRLEAVEARMPQPLELGLSQAAAAVGGAASARSPSAPLRPRLELRLGEHGRPPVSHAAGSAAGALRSVELESQRRAIAHRLQLGGLEGRLSAMEARLGVAAGPASGGHGQAPSGPEEPSAGALAPDLQRHIERIAEQAAGRAVREELAERAGREGVRLGELEERIAACSARVEEAGAVQQELRMQLMRLTQRLDERRASLRAEAARTGSPPPVAKAARPAGAGAGGALNLWTLMDPDAAREAETTRTRLQEAIDRVSVTERASRPPPHPPGPRRRSRSRTADAGCKRQTVTGLHREAHRSREVVEGLEEALEGVRGQLASLQGGQLQPGLDPGAPQPGGRAGLPALAPRTAVPAHVSAGYASGAGSPGTRSPVPVSPLLAARAAVALGPAPASGARSPGPGSPSLAPRAAGLLSVRPGPGGSPRTLRPLGGPGGEQGYDPHAGPAPAPTPAHPYPEPERLQLGPSVASSSRVRASSGSSET